MTNYEESLKKYVEAMVQIQRAIYSDQLIYCGMEEIVLASGQFDIAQPLPAGFNVGRMKECFRNAFLLMLEGYTYVEGIAMTESALFPIHHGWCVDTNNRVLDTTWSDGVAYFGVHLSQGFVLERVQNKGRYGVFGSKNALDIYKHGLPQEALTR
jgi:hypothetical protein